jgi:8-oxo-dGTP pyrophosphatase MutT (NUDIX family)
VSAGFRRLGEDVVHRGYAIEVAVGRYAAPDGHQFTRDVVRHPGAVAVLPLHDDGTVTVVRQYRAPIEQELVEIPAGLRDVDGEDLLVTAERELAEEVGLAARRFEHLGRFHVAAGLTDEVVHLYLATGLHDVAADNQGPEEEAMTIERHSLDDLLAMVGRGEITDAKTIISALLVAQRRPGAH